MGNIKDLKAYRIVEEKDLPEVHGKGYVGAYKDKGKGPHH